MIIASRKNSSQRSVTSTGAQALSRIKLLCFDHCDKYFLCAVLTACTIASAIAAPPPGEALARVGTIDIVVRPEQIKYEVRNMGAQYTRMPGGGFVADLIVDEFENKRGDRLTAAFKSQNVAFNSFLAEQLLLKLTAAGYVVAIVHGEWDLVDGKNVYRKDSIHSTADAVLFVSPVIVGFVSKNPLDAYLPTMMVHVALLDKDGRPPFYRGSHAAGWSPMGKVWRTSPPKKAFRDFQALIESPVDSAAALYDAAQDIASSIADDLKK